MNQPLSKPGVDTHFHVFVAHQGRPGARYIPRYDAPLATWAAAAQAVGIQRGVVVQTSFLGSDHGPLLTALAQGGESLRGIAVLDPQAPPDELHTLHAAGVRGLRLNLAGVSHDLSAWQGATALWDTVAALGWQVELHTDQGALPAVLAQLPAGLTLVLDHMAKPHAVAAQDASVAAARAWVARGGQVWVKLSGAYRLGGLDARALARLWLGELGGTQLLWGSDWPCTNHEACAHYARLRGALDDWLPDPTDREAVLADNPARLYGWV